MKSSTVGVAHRRARQVDLEAEPVAPALARRRAADRARDRPSGRSPGSGRSARRSAGTSPGGDQLAVVVAHPQQQLGGGRRGRVGERQDRLRVSTKRSSVERVADALRATQARARRAGAVAVAPESASRSRPASLASYIAMSASTSSSSARQRGRRRSNSAHADRGGHAHRPRSPTTTPCSRDGLEQRLARPRRPPRAALCGRITPNSSPPSAADDVGLAQRGAQRRGDRAEQLVAGGVAERVVDVLEVVEVERRARAPRCRSARRTASDAVELLLEAAAVEQPGQRVVVGEVLQLALEALAVGDVLHLRARRAAWRAGRTHLDPDGAASARDGRLGLAPWPGS